VNILLLFVANTCRASWSDSSDSNTEIKGEIIWDIDGNCTFRVSYRYVEGQRMKSTKDGRNWTRYLSVISVFSLGSMYEIHGVEQ
jgi:hypothetical protein